MPAKTGDGELFTYTPNEKDPRDVAFAEKYNANEIARKFPCKQIQLIDPNEGYRHKEGELEEEMVEVAENYTPSGNYRHYCIGGLRMIWELYDGSSSYMLFPPAGLDTTNYDRFFSSFCKYIKPKQFWKPKENPFQSSHTMRIKQKMEEKKMKEEGSGDIEATFNSIKEKKLEKIRLQTLLEPHGM